MPDEVLERQLSVTMPEKIRLALSTGKRYIVIKGGRGKGGSWSIARYLIGRAVKQRIRVLCCREIQKSIAESVYQLLIDQIGLLGLEHCFTIKSNTIECPITGSLFVFEGIRTLDVLKIKSFEGFDIAWVEEAQAISKRSWEILIPTIRKPGSQILLNLNPELDTDETYRRFIVRSPPDTEICEVSWRDNPWFPEVLERERAYLEQVDKSDYENIWEGKCRAALPGAIYADEIRAAIEARRIRPMSYDPKLKVHLVWDLGWNDLMAIAFVQRLLNQIMVIDYLEDRYKKYDWYVAQIKQRNYNLGKCFLPHDAGHESPQPVDSPDKVIKAMGMNVVVVEREVSVEVGIKRTRQIFPQIYFDEDKASVLIEHLRRYRRSIPTTHNEPQTPVHDEHSHGADVLRLTRFVAPQMSNEDEGFWEKKIEYDNTGIV